MSLIKKRFIIHIYLDQLTIYGPICLGKSIEYMLLTTYLCDFCEFLASVHGLRKWYAKTFKKFGWMLLAKQWKHELLVKSYVDSVERLRVALKAKADKIIDLERKEELLIMEEHLSVLQKHVNSVLK